ncbi:MAG: hypothetical protein ACWGQW_05070 [bacterium]
MIHFDPKNPSESITVKIALALSKEYGWITLREMNDSYEGDDYIIVSDTVEVTFTPFTRGELIPKIIEGMREQQRDIRAKAERSCAAINDKITTLLALEN